MRRSRARMRVLAEKIEMTSDFGCTRLFEKCIVCESCNHRAVFQEHKTRGTLLYNSF